MSQTQDEKIDALVATYHTLVDEHYSAREVVARMNKHRLGRWLVKAVIPSNLLKRLEAQTQHSDDQIKELVAKTRRGGHGQ